MLNDKAKTLSTKADCVELVIQLLSKKAIEYNQYLIPERVSSLKIHLEERYKKMSLEEVIIEAETIRLTHLFL